MKFAKKMMLVPAGRAIPEIETMTALDNEMANVLKNNQLSTNEKINMYNQILQKNLLFESRLKKKNTKPRNNNIQMPGSSIQVKPESATLTGNLVDISQIERRNNTDDELDDLYFDAISLSDSKDNLELELKTPIPVVKPRTVTKKPKEPKKAQKKLNLNDQSANRSSNSFVLTKWGTFNLRNKKPVNYAPVDMSVSYPSPKSKDPDWIEPSRKRKRKN